MIVVPKKRSLVLAAAAMLVSTGMAVSKQPTTSMTVMFTTNAMPNIAQSELLPPVAEPGFSDGDQLSASDILSRIAPVAGVETASSSYGAGNLSLLVESVSEGGELVSELYSLGDCAAISLDQVEGDALPERAHCDDHTYSLSLVEQGVAILVDEEWSATLELPSGSYLINGLPYHFN